MPYSQFTIPKVVEDFGLTLIESGAFLNATQTVTLSPYLEEFITKNLQLAIALNTEKARSELIICPVLLAIKETLPSISFFSGEEFNVDADLGLNGVCDYILSQSAEQLYVTAPVTMVVEAKKENLKGGLGQCIAEMVAAWKFNTERNSTISCIYGVVTTGTVWRFLKLQEQTVTIDLNEYPLPPINSILAKLTQMMFPQSMDTVR
ncbi:hypothetical protein GSN00_13020 [Cylindrospermopsis raciborskii CHAB3438]|jgi:hypothetical protein|uniref:hypothetical protein n=1 Tax=Cylindrospermopsis TaxID=77021 RepID=UPI00070C97B5|nr:MULTISPECIES: hypothetical protein [Cylindrospermopsis]MBU6346829.1 hypothetical protein [Cyanobacteria bacterium REEB494]KRH98388.1 hypothetical protein ASL19_12180 [Cylindrospermopsis sp. CR12]MCH4905271.1 hypothetical protein [Cylindrospermopsis raciborskii CHAB3438]MEB3144541.1 hypothetical protein [Cylindrospermopsis raciborskii]UJL33096.1 hypothetical protein C6N34_013300 [Cylindrospermopsis raciborskii Cr2010]